MRRLYGFFFLWIFFSLASAQPYGHEWINYSQKYYKVYIINEGIYRLDSSALASSGITLSGLDPRNFQVFHRGREQAIFVKGESDGIFNSSDYIEFYANRNDGHLDSLVYDTADIPNPYHSLYCDTAAYFLTWNSSTSNLRLQAITDTTFSSFTPVPYFIREQLSMTPGQYFYGPRNVFGSTMPQFHSTEGWFGTQFQKGDVRNITFNTSYLYSAGPNSQLITKVAGVSDDYTIFTADDHELRIDYNTNSGTVMLSDSTFNGFSLLSYSFSFPSSNLTASTTFSYTSVNNPMFTWNNLSAICFARFRFPHTTDMEGQSRFMLFVPDNPNQAKSYLRLSNFVNGSSSVFMYDMTTRKRFVVTPDSGFHKVLVPNSGSEKQCYIFAENQVTNLASVIPVSSNAMFTNYAANGFDSAFIIVTHRSLWNEASQYAAYRSTPAGGSNPVILADIEQLYDQYAWGIHYNPMSIRRFADRAGDNSVTKPVALFLIGKSITFPDARDYSPWLAMTLVPSHGYPTTDAMLTAGLNGTIVEPSIPTGRISALTGQEVLDYLAKVQAFEGNAPAEWMKHALHFGGGGNTTEQQQFYGYLQQYEGIFEDTLFGGTVHTFLKTSSQPIQITLSDSVEALINRGVTLMTFFGHSSGSSFDQNLDNPNNYMNAGKYPLILANSCYSGDIHQAPGQLLSSSSEEWVFAPNAGAIGFLASIGQGISFYLTQYSSAFYQQFCRYNHGSSIGQCMKAAIDSIQGTGTNEFVNITCLEMNLHGDPSLVLNSWPLPDYSIADSSVFFTPEGAITADLDSFTVNVVVTNLGKAPRDTVYVELKRIFPDNSTQIYLKPVPFVLYRDTVSFRLPVDRIKGPGLNRFEVWVDQPQSITELSELNNQLSTPALLLILSGDIVPVYPYNYAIIPDDSVILKASTGNPFEPAHNYRFEIDTTDTYPNPLAFSTISSAGGVLTWKVPLTLTDSTVYYWRVRRDTSDTVNYRWKEFSFQYIPGKRGWAQAHFFQFKNDGYSFIDHNRTNRSFDFITSGKTLFVDVYGQEPPNYNYTQMSATQYKLDFTLQEYGGCIFDTSINVVVIDPYTLTPWGNRWYNPADSTMYNPTHFYDNSNDIPSGAHCARNRIEKFFVFRIAEADDMAGMKRMLVDSVPNGHYILAYSWLHGDFGDWVDTSLFTTFENLGADTGLRNKPDVPWIFFCKKGDPGSALEVFGDSTDQFISLNTVLTNNASFGTIYSEVIGPAASWDSLSWRQYGLENPQVDSVSLSIIGIKPNGVEELIRTIPPDSANIYLSNISAVTYPKMKLGLFIMDDSLQTCAQMDKWQVFYQPAPEVAVNPKLSYTFYSDTIEEGDSLIFRVAVQNISEFTMDSMLVTHWIVDQNRVMHPLPTYMSKGLAPDSFLVTNLKVSTENYPGLNSVWMEINPIGQPQTRNEQYHFNNIAQLGFFVTSDKENPLLDVTFDGIHILNGDIVSARPDILVQLKDENQFLALNDTTDFKIWLKYPGDPSFTRIYFSNTVLSFTEALLPDNSCRINLKPLLAGDGTYELLVQAQDRSSNLSGSIDYRVTFEVINKPSITEVMNYPNPFSTSTKFVFTLTGSEIPEQFTIQILTITGKVVREITREELGALHIGRNITDYAWDGKDNFGDPLANGVYLYKVMVRLNNQGIEKRESGADQWIHKGFGKMYLMR